MKREVWIFTLGNEVVDGRIVNTNAAYLGRRLTLLGLDVFGNISLIDDVNLVTQFLRYVLSRGPKLVVTTGGLGPTYDDRTLEAVAKATDRRLVLNEEALRMVREKYESAGMGLTPEREKMAYLPEGAEPVPNPVGTAPGSWLSLDDIIIVSLPGVPKELKAMWEGYVEPRLKQLFPGVRLVERWFRVVGIPESSAAAVVKEVLKLVGGRSLYIKSHPKGSEMGEPVLDFYVSASSVDEDPEGLVERAVTELIERLKALGGEVVMSPSEEPD